MATLEEKHRLMLDKAFESFASSDQRLQVQTMEGVVVKMNINVLLLFSPFLRELLMQSGDPSESLLILPNVTCSALLAMSNLITSGKTNLDLPALEMVNAAMELGITGLSIGGLEDTSDTSSVSTIAIQDAADYQGDSAALPVENPPATLPDNVTARPTDPTIADNVKGGRKRKVNESEVVSNAEDLPQSASGNQQKQPQEQQQQDNQQLHQQQQQHQQPQQKHQKQVHQQQQQHNQQPQQQQQQHQQPPNDEEWVGPPPAKRPTPEKLVGL